MDGEITRLMCFLRMRCVNYIRSGPKVNSFIVFLAFLLDIYDVLPLHHSKTREMVKDVWSPSICPQSIVSIKCSMQKNTARPYLSVLSLTEHLLLEKKNGKMEKKERKKIIAFIYHLLLILKFPLALSLEQNQC